MSKRVKGLAHAGRADGRGRGEGGGWVKLPTFQSVVKRLNHRATTAPADHAELKSSSLINILSG